MQLKFCFTFTACYPPVRRSLQAVALVIYHARVAVCVCVHTCVTLGIKAELSQAANLSGVHVSLRYRHPV